MLRSLVILDNQSVGDKSMFNDTDLEMSSQNIN